MLAAARAAVCAIDRTARAGERRESARTSSGGRARRAGTRNSSPARGSVGGGSVGGGSVGGGSVGGGSVGGASLIVGSGVRRERLLQQRRQGAVLGGGEAAEHVAFGLVQRLEQRVGLA